MTSITGTHVHHNPCLAAKVGGTVSTKLRSTATQSVCADDGQEAVTVYKVLSEYADAAQSYTLVQAEPKTGSVLASLRYLISK